MARSVGDNGPVRRRSILLAVWLVGTVLATSLAWSAVSLVGARVTEQQAAATDLVVANRVPPTADATGSGPTTTTAIVVTEVARGGQASFTCDDGEPALVDASPNLGWERDRRAPEGEVWFDHEGDDSAIRATCEAGLPIVEVSEEDYDEGEDEGHHDDEDDGSDDTTTTTVPPTTPAPAGTAPPATVDDAGGDDPDEHGTATTFDDSDDDDGGDEDEPREDDDEPREDDDHREDDDSHADDDHD